MTSARSPVEVEIAKFWRYSNSRFNKSLEQLEEIEERLKTLTTNAQQQRIKTFRSKKKTDELDEKMLEAKTEIEMHIKAISHQLFRLEKELKSIY